MFGLYYPTVISFSEVFALKGYENKPAFGCIMILFFITSIKQSLLIDDVLVAIEVSAHLHILS